MRPTEEELREIRIAAIWEGETDEYVYLRKDENGFMLNMLSLKVL